jgi:hypothetical protein
MEKDGNVSHRFVDAYAARCGVPVSDYPGRGVAYTLGHGDNLYDTWSRRARVWLDNWILSSSCDADFA